MAILNLLFLSLTALSVGSIFWLSWFKIFDLCFKKGKDLRLTAIPFVTFVLEIAIVIFINYLAQSWKIEYGLVAVIFYLLESEILGARLIRRKRRAEESIPFWIANPERLAYTEDLRRRSKFLGFVGTLTGVIIVLVF